MTTFLSDLIEYQIGGGWGAEEPTPLSPDAAFVIRGTDIPPALVGDVSGVPFRFHKSSNLRSRVLRHHDIVFEVSGGSKGQPVGRALLVSDRLLEKFDGTAAMCASFCKLIRLNAEVCDPRFVFRLLQAAYADGSLDAFQVQSTGITNFRWQPFLDQYQVDLPPRHAQQRVADVLQAMDDLIENSRRRVEIMGEMVRAIYREWFVHFRYPGYEDLTFVDSDLGPIPEGWRASTCGAELDFVGGGTPSKKEPAYWEDGTIDWFTPSDLTKTRLRYPTRSGLRITEAGLAKSSAKLVPPGTVMMTSRATLGVLAITTVPSSTNQGFISVLPDERWPANFVREFLDASAEDLAAIGTGATFKEITKGAFKSFPFLVPEQSVLDEYRAATADAELLVASLEQAGSRLVALRDMLLPKLVTGQIDVSDLDLEAVVEKASI